MNIAFIPVRGGSKSIPLKNVKPINGKPLVYWTALAAEKSKIIDKIIIATDSKEIKKTVLNFGFKTEASLEWKGVIGNNFEIMKRKRGIYGSKI